MWLMWLLVIILLTALEVVTINLVSIWFIISAIVSLFLSFAVDSFYIQFGVFVGLGIILMLLTRPYLVKKLSKKKVRTNAYFSYYTSISTSTFKISLTSPLGMTEEPS